MSLLHRETLHDCRTLLRGRLMWKEVAEVNTNDIYSQLKNG